MGVYKVTFISVVFLNSTVCLHRNKRTSIYCILYITFMERFKGNNQIVAKLLSIILRAVDTSLAVLLQKCI